MGQEFLGWGCRGTIEVANPGASSAHCSFNDALIRFSRDHLQGDALAPHYVPYLLAAFNHQSALRYQKPPRITFIHPLLSSYDVWTQHTLGH